MKKRKKLIAGLTVATILSTSTVVFAAPFNAVSGVASANPNILEMRMGNVAQRANMLVNPYEELLTNGTIDQATYDSIIKFIEEKRADIVVKADEKTQHAQRVDMLSELLTDGIITQEQYDAIKSVAANGIKIIREGAISKTPFDELLADGTLDQTTYDAIKAFLKISRQSIVKGSVEDGQKVTKVDKVDVFSELLSNGIITQAQHDAIKAAMTENVKEFRVELSNPFSDLLSNGTIDQATLDKIKAYMEEKRQTIITSEAKEKIQKFDIFSELLENGLLTQSQYDSIKAAMPTQQTLKNSSHL